MIDTFRQLPDIYFFPILAFLLFFCLWLGWKMQGYYLQFKFRREKQNIEVDYGKVQQGMKKIWDQECSALNEEKKQFQKEIKILKERVDSYRKKLSRLGIFSFVFGKRHSEMLYSLLLENEILEQLIHAPATQANQKNIKYLKGQFTDIKERQKLVSRIFNDVKIKNYVNDILNEEEHKLSSKKSTDQ